MAKVRYIGDYYKVMFDKNVENELIGVEAGPWGNVCLRVFSENFEDDGVFPLSDFYPCDDEARSMIADAQRASQAGL